MWVEELVTRWLIGRGYWVLKQRVPILIVSGGTGTFKELTDGAKLYKILMPPNHKLFVVFNTVLTREL
jgi:hypothetical protein